ncbi:MAG: cupin domain-containing protein [Microgenomates group bacterium]|jgi:mannose-6-phosphate isomerase-like protein (cupin superfamily)
MKIVKKEDVKRHENSALCTAYEYPIGDKDINGAVVEVSGRYPDSGRVVNLECKEMAYIIKGNGKVIVEDNEINLKEGDLVLIEPNEKYFWEGNLTMFVPCTPAWFPEQHKKV